MDATEIIPLGTLVNEQWNFTALTEEDITKEVRRLMTFANRQGLNVTEEDIVREVQKLYRTLHKDVFESDTAPAPLASVHEADAFLVHDLANKFAAFGSGVTQMTVRLRELRTLLAEQEQAAAAERESFEAQISVLGVKVETAERTLNALRAKIRAIDLAPLQAQIKALDPEDA